MEKIQYESDIVFDNAAMVRDVGGAADKQSLQRSCRERTGHVSGYRLRQELPHCRR